MNLLSLRFISAALVAFAFVGAHAGTISIPFPGPGAAASGGVVPIGTPTSLGTPTVTTADATSFTFTTSAIAPVGNTIIVSTQNLSGGASFKTVTSITDSAGNTYSAGGTGAQQLNGGFRSNSEIWIARVTTQLNSASTITVNYSTAGSGGNGNAIQAIQVSGLVASPIDKTAIFTAAPSAQPTTTSAVLSQANELVIVTSAFQYQTASTFTEDTTHGFATLINRTNIGFNTGIQVMCLSWKIVAATTAVSYASTLPIWSGAPNIASAEVMVTLKGN